MGWGEDGPAPATQGGTCPQHPGFETFSLGDPPRRYGGRCCGARRAPKPARRETGMEVTSVPSVPAVTLRPARTSRHLSGETRGSGVGRACGQQKTPSRSAERRLSPPPLPFNVTKASRPSRTLPLARRRSAGPRERVRLQPRRGSRGQPPQIGSPPAPPVPSRGRRGGRLSPGTEAASPPHSADQDDRAEAPSRRQPDPASCPGHGALPLSRRALPRVGTSRPPHLVFAKRCRRCHSVSTLPAKAGLCNWMGGCKQHC